MQYVQQFSTIETRERIKDIYNYLQGDNISKIRAVSFYYSLFADILPYLELDTSKKFNPATLKAMEFIEKNCCEDFTMNELAFECNISESRLYHLFNEELKTTPVTYKNEIRVQKSLEYIRENDDTIETISEKVGFKSTVHFRKLFKSVTGFNPAQYRKLCK